jgi:hypothetical protein
MMKVKKMNIMRMMVNIMMMMVKKTKMMVKIVVRRKKYSFK